MRCLKKYLRRSLQRSGWTSNRSPLRMFESLTAMALSASCCANITLVRLHGGEAWKLPGDSAKEVGGPLKSGTQHHPHSIGARPSPLSYCLNWSKERFVRPWYVAVPSRWLLLLLLLTTAVDGIWEDQSRKLY